MAQVLPRYKRLSLMAKNLQRDPLYSDELGPIAGQAQITVQEEEQQQNS